MRSGVNLRKLDDHAISLTLDETTQEIFRSPSESLICSPRSGFGRADRSIGSGLRRESSSLAILFSTVITPKQSSCAYCPALSSLAIFR